MLSRISRPFSTRILTTFAWWVLTAAVPLRGAQTDYRFTTLSPSVDITDPRGIALLPNGDAVVAVTGSGTIVRVTPDGTVTPFAGSEDNRPELKIEAGHVYNSQIVDDTREHFFASQIAVDALGNVFAPHGYSVRRMSPDGVVSTLAGVADQQGSSDGSGSSARFHTISAMAADSQGNLYVGDSFNYTIRRITPAGEVTTFAGTVGLEGMADGQGTAATFSLIHGIAIDAADNLWVSSAGLIRKVTPAGQVTTVSGKFGTRGMTGYWDATGLDTIYGPNLPLAWAPSGALWIADEVNSALRVMAPDTSVTSVGGKGGWTGLVDGLNQDSRFNHPQGIAVFANGNVLIADTANHKLRLGVREFTPEAVLGTYFGTTSAGTDWALWLREPGHGIFSTRLPNSPSALITEVTIDDGDTFRGSAAETLPLDATAAPATHQVSGTITQVAPGQFSVTGAIATAGLTFSGAFPRTGSGTAFSGSFYTAIALGSAQGTLYTAVGYSGDFLATIVLPDRIEAARGLLAVDGRATVTTDGGAQLSIDVDTSQHLLSGSLVLPTSATSSALRRVTGGNPSSSSTLRVPQADANGTIRFAGLAAGAESSSRLVNLSIRSQAGAGDQTLIMGFVVAGPDTKATLIRGIGPTLTSFGVDGAAQNPRLLLFGSGSSTEPIAENDNWAGTNALRETFNRLGAFALDDTSADAALVRTLPAGPYTAQIRTSPAGVALIEAYDADDSHQTRLLNLSARTTAGTGSAIFTAGFVVIGNAPIRLLVRGIGPTLESFGVSGVLTDPQLELFDHTRTQVAANDNWGGEAQIATAAHSVGAFALADPESKDAAVLVALVPGSYTVQVSGTDGETGIAMIELYELP